MGSNSRRPDERLPTYPQPGCERASRVTQTADPAGTYVSLQARPDEPRFGSTYERR